MNSKWERWFKKAKKKATRLLVSILGKGATAE